MPSLFRTTQAHRDLLKIWVYLAENSFETADRILDAIDRTCRMLADNPSAGRSREELAPGIRSFPSGKYIVYYRPTEEGIVVLRVVRGERDTPTLFPSL